MNTEEDMNRLEREIKLLFIMTWVLLLIMFYGLLLLFSS